MFLAATAIQEFWKKDEPLLFPGEWCKLFRERDTWEKIDYAIMRPMWDDSARIEAAYVKCKSLYDRILPLLAQKLNQTNGVDKSPHYYNILLGNWLMNYISHLYDKYLLLDEVEALYPNVETWGLDREQWYYPLHSKDYILASSKDDRSQLQQFTQMFSYFNIRQETHQLSDPLSQPDKYVHHAGTKSACHRWLDGMALKYRNPVYAVSTSKPSKALRLLLRSFGRIVSDPFRFECRIPLAVNREMREGRSLGCFQDKFEQIVSDLVFQNIPVLFLEGFNEMRQQVLERYVEAKVVYMESGLFYSSPQCLFYLSECATNSRILLQQHGGGIGVEAHNWAEDFERSICDTYYTFGWTDGPQTRPLGHEKLRSLNVDKEEKQTDVLFAMLEYSRYLQRFIPFPQASSFLEGYIEFGLKFLNALDKDNSVLIRPYPSIDCAWDIQDRYVEAGVEFPFDDFSKSFDRRLMQTRLYVVDHMQTTFIQAMANDVPTVLLMNKDFINFRENLWPVATRLEQAGILFYSQEEAAKHVNAVCKEPQIWWKSRNVQEARLAFIDMHGSLCEDWMNDFRREMVRQAKAV